MGGIELEHHQQLSIMHRAFDSEDIIYSVLKHLKRKDLKRVAMTCSRLACPALNILWSRRSSLVPFIMCLPQDTWEIEDTTINLSREPTPSEWERLRMNASRVRRLIEPDPDSSWRSTPPKLSVSNLVLRRLFEQFPPATLFPNLYAFDSYALRESSSDLSLVQKFMSPGLEALLVDVSAHLPTHEVEQFFGALPIEAHGLRQLSISMDHGATAFLPSFGKLPKLIALTIRGVDVCLTRQVITNIQQARCLNTLELSLHGTSFDGGIMALELSSLEHLSLSGNVLPQCTHFIRQISTRQLSDVIIEYRQPASSSEITVFMESLSISCQNHGSLKQISVADKSDLNIDADERVIPLSSEVFRPLLKFTGLLFVAFKGIGNFHLDNRFINDIPDAWPSIQVLKFAASDRPAFCAVTFTAMVSFASRCKSLRSLHLTCDASQPTIIPQAEDGTERLWPAQTALRELDFVHSYVPDSEVARIPYILAKVFPALLPLDVGCSFYVGRGFNNINVSLRPLQEVCEQLKVLRQLAGQDDHVDTFWNSDMEWDSEDSEEGDSMGGV